MKKYIVLLLFSLLLITNISFGQSGWYWQNPLPQGNDLFSVKFVNNNTAFAGGGCGTIIKTTDSGNTWKIIRTDSSYNNTSLFFHNLNTGWITSSKDYSHALGPLGSKVMKTTDSGNNWVEKFYLGGSYMYSIEFTGLDTGYIMVGNSANGFIYKTVDGGNNWDQIFSISGKYFYKSFFINNSTGFICGSVGISKTINGGFNWVNQYQFSQSGSINSIKFMDNNTGIAIGVSYSYPNQIILKTTNSGNNWTSVTGAGNNVLYDMCFLNNNTGYTCGANILLKSTNAGSNWINIPLSENRYFESLDFSSANGLIAGDLGIIFKTNDYGANWVNNFPSQRTGYGINSIKFYDKSIGYAITGSRLLKTTNGGNNWVTGNTITNQTLNAISVIDSNIVYVAGGEPSMPPSVLYRSSNGGLNWTTQNSQSYYGIVDMSFPNASTGYCLCWGSISKTTDGGNNWVNVVGIGGFSIHFVNPNTGYVVDFGGGKKTTDGGNSWISIPVDGESVYFLNADTGFVAGYGMTIRKTINGGISWVTQAHSSEGWRFYGIDFFNSMYGVAAGEFGAIASTTDGGNNWIYQMSPTNNLLNSVYMVDTNICYVAGLNNTILKTTNGGIPIGISDLNNENPKTFILHQNYPNPFNPVTKIKFGISKISFAKIIIYDILGREVATLLNEELKPGTYSVDWDGSNYASGIYFYRLEASDFVETKKMVLMK